jgi:cytoskeleton protein RodZ
VAKLAPTQIEQLHAIGAHLSQVRREKGLSIDAVANQIFIRPALLKALENGNDADLPEPVFVQGFIRRYAEALGLDGKAISQDFPVTPVDVLPDPNLLEKAETNGVVEPEVRHRIKVLEKADPASSPPPVTVTRRSPWPMIAAIAGLGLVMGLIIWAIAGRGERPATVDTPDETEVTTAATDSPPRAESNTDTAANSEDNQDISSAALDNEAEEPASATLEAPIVVAVSLSDRSWLSVNADGEVVYEGTPESGFEETWTAENSLVFTTGNAGGVELSVNGEDSVVLGENGVVRTITLTPDSDADSLLQP